MHKQPRAIRFLAIALLLVAPSFGFAEPHDFDRSFPNEGILDQGPQKARSRCSNQFILLAAVVSVLALGTPQLLPPHTVRIDESANFSMMYGNDLSPEEEAVLLYSESDIENLYPRMNDNNCHGITCVTQSLLRKASYGGGHAESEETVTQKLSLLLRGQSVHFRGVRDAKELYEKYGPTVKAAIEQSQSEQPESLLTIPSLNHFLDAPSVQAPFSLSIPTEWNLEELKRLEEETRFAMAPETRAFEDAIRNIRHHLVNARSQENFRRHPFRSVLKTYVTREMWDILSKEEKNRYLRADAGTLKSWIDKGGAPEISIHTSHLFGHAIRVVGYVKKKGEQLPSAFYIYDSNHPQTVRPRLALREDDNGVLYWAYARGKMEDGRLSTPDIAPNDLLKRTIGWYPSDQGKGARLRKENTVIQVIGK